MSDSPTSELAAPSVSTRLAKAATLLALDNHFDGAYEDLFLLLNQLGVIFANDGSLDDMFTAAIAADVAAGNTDQMLSLVNPIVAMLRRR